MFLSRGDGHVGELLELHLGCQGPFQGSRGKEGFLSRRHSGKGPHFTLRGEFPVFSRVAAGIWGFLSSYSGDLSEPLVCLRKVWSPCELERSLGIPLQLVQGPRSSSRVEAGTSVFLTSAAMDLVVPMDFQQGSHASCLVERRKLAFLSSCKSSLRLPCNTLCSDRVCGPVCGSTSDPQGV